MSISRNNYDKLNDEKNLDLEKVDEIQYISLGEQHENCNHYHDDMASPQINQLDIQYATISESKKKAQSTLQKVALVCIIFIAIEVTFGLIANSLAIISDAAHMFSDLSSFLISIISIELTGLSISNTMSYGFHRSEVIGALCSVMLIWGMTVWLFGEAIHRLIYKPVVNAKIMFIIAVVGLGFNLIMAKLLHSTGHSHSHGSQKKNKGISSQQHNGHSHLKSEKLGKNLKKKESLSSTDSHLESHINHVNSQINNNQNERKSENSSNEVVSNSSIISQNVKKVKEETISQRAAKIHVLGDIIQSIGVIVAATIIWTVGEKATYADPICTIIFAIIVLNTTYPTARDCLIVFMEGTPSNINEQKLKDELNQIFGIISINDLHIWSIATDKIALTAKILSSDPEVTKEEAKTICQKYNIYHYTLQVEEPFKFCQFKN